MVYYRKYRPQTLDQVIGQETAKQALLHAFSDNRLAHAYLFCGPKGTGKTSTARILAKMVNCEKFMGESTVHSLQTTAKTAVDGRPNAADIPCNECTSCRSITDGSNLDFVEIDAASNRGIDDIRALRETIKLAPSSAKKKVYVIDEVHMLTTEAFNALLKTLEEPPSHVLFILATTEAHKIPATILSRVQKLDFQLATKESLIKALQNVAEKENLEIEPQALELIAKRSEGSFRDCLKLVDQLASHGTKITAVMVSEAVNAGRPEDVAELLICLSEKDTGKALKVVQKQVETGVNLKEFIGEVLESLRQVLLSQPGAPKMSLSEAILLIGLMHQALERMRYSSIPSLPLEVAIVSASQTASAPAVSVVSQISVSAKTIEEPVSRNADTPTPADLAENLVQPTPADSAESVDLTKIQDKWNYILETVKPYNYSLEALLRQVHVKSCDDAIVMLEVPYTFHQRILEAPKSRNLLESVISDVLSKTVRVSCVLGKRPTKVEELANVELAADDDVIRIAAEIFNS
jgi:DNA polymerase-3 subunit gamma/tau